MIASRDVDDTMNVGHSAKMMSDSDTIYRARIRIQQFISFWAEAQHTKSGYRSKRTLIFMNFIKATRMPSKFSSVFSKKRNL